MHQIRAISLYSYLAVARSVGLDGLKLLAEVGIARSALDDPRARLPAGAAIRLLERSAEESHCDSFGLRMARVRSFASLGPISLLLERLANVSQVLDTLSSQRRSLSDVFFVAVDVEDQTVTAKFDLVPPFSRPQAADLTVALSCIALSASSGGRWRPEAVHFTHAAPKDLKTFKRFFAAPLMFSSDFNGFSFGVGMLKVPLPLADKEMAQNASELLETVTLPAMLSPASDHARHSIGLLLPEGRGSLEEVAKNLNLSARVLQRQLQAEGTTFAKILSEVKRDLARRHLQGSEESMTRIAQSLGYADLSSFTRWFDREFGSAPSAWRKEMRLASTRPPPAWRR